MSMSQDYSGQKLGQYELRERLGRGGMADVYRAFQPGLERFVAVKLMLDRLASDEEFVERFRREAQSVGQLRHAHIVNVFDFGIENDAYYMVMEFIKGDNLKAHITQNSQGMAFDDALRITSQIADALAYAHKAGMIHRDVKPANIMFVDDTLEHAILTDFGIAYILSQPGLTASGAMVGTPAYLSPEIAAGQSADERADLYGLGIILYEMLTGRVPYEADTPLAVIMKHVNSPLPLPSEFGRDMPDAIEQIILKALMKDPADRYQTAADMKAALDHTRSQLAESVPLGASDDQTEKVVVNNAATLPVAARDETRPSTPQPAGRSPLLWGGVVAVVAIVIVAALALLSGGGGQTPAEPTSVTDQPTQAAVVLTDDEPTSTVTEELTLEPTATEAATSTEPPTSTSTDEPTLMATDAPTIVPSLAPTEVAELPEAVAQLYEAGLLSGLTPLQDEIDILILSDEAEAGEEQLNQMLESDPENVAALTARALLLVYFGDADLALEDADRAIELAPDSPLGYIARAEVMQQWEIDDAEGSMEAVDQALALDPENPEVLWRASLNHFELDDPDAFFGTLEQAETLGATGFRFVDFASEYLYYAEQYERALPYLEKRLTIDPQYMYSLRLLVLDLLYLDRAADAYAAVQNFPGVFVEPGDLGMAAFVAYRAGDYDRAREWAETARALSEEAHAATYLLGLIGWDADHNLEAAMGYFDQLNEVDFYDEFLTIELGHEMNIDRARILMEAGEPEAAAGALQRALDVFGPYPPVLEALANALLEVGDVDAARENLRMALENTEDNPDEQRRLLDRIRELGAVGDSDRPQIDLLSGLTPLQDEIDSLLISRQFDIAENRLGSIIGDDPENTEALAARALIRIMNGRHRLALRDADRVIEVEPELPLGFIVRSDVLNNMGNHEAALEAAEIALSLDPGNPEALWRASHAHAGLGNWDTHFDFLNQAIEAEARGLRFVNFAGEFLYYAGDYDRAQPYLEVWHRAMPGNIDSTVFLAANLLQLGGVDEAYELVQSYQSREMLEIPEVAGWAAYVAYRAGDIDQARRWASVGLTRHPEQPNAHYVLGLISWDADGDLGAALEHLDVLGQMPEFWDLFLNPDRGHQVDYDRGRILAAAGELEEAVDAFHQALERDPRPYIAEALADVFLALENPEAALGNLHRALEMTENPDERMRLLERIQGLEG